MTVCGRARFGNWREGRAMPSARFEGEAAQPPILLRCGYCGGAIRHGCAYYEADGLAVCDECAKRYAWARFLEQARRRTATPENWL